MWMCRRMALSCAPDIKEPPCSTQNLPSSARHLLGLRESNKHPIPYLGMHRTEPVLGKGTWTYKDNLNRSPDFTPAQYFFHYAPNPRPKYMKSLAMHMVNSARMCILVLWHSTQPPMVRDWIKSEWIMWNGEDDAHDTYQKVYMMWACWLGFWKPDKRAMGFWANKIRCKRNNLNFSITVWNA